MRVLGVDLGKKRIGLAISDEEGLRPYLGAPRFSSEVAERTAETGVATGLSWTSVGGEILFIECTKMHGTANFSSPASSATS